MNWLISLLGGIPRIEYDRVTYLYVKQNQLMNDLIAKHEMQSAWEQLKQERKMRRVH
jgi:hypothetical protein